MLLPGGATHEQSAQESVRLLLYPARVFGAEAGEKPERRLVLRIMDAQSLMAEKRSIDSFISGFELAWQLSMELNQYEKERSVSRCTAKRSGVLSMSGEEKEP